MSGRQYKTISNGQILKFILFMNSLNQNLFLEKKSVELLKLLSTLIGK